MLFKLAILVLAVACCGSSTIYSSFWAPIFNPRILNFRVDATFNHEDGMRDRERYENNYGVRGERLIQDLGNGNGPNRDVPRRDKEMREVRFFYTYPGANQDEEYRYK